MLLRSIFSLSETTFGDDFKVSSETNLKKIRWIATEKNIHLSLITSITISFGSLWLPQLYLTPTCNQMQCLWISNNLFKPLPDISLILQWIISDCKRWNIDNFLFYFCWYYSKIDHKTKLFAKGYPAVKTETLFSLQERINNIFLAIINKTVVYSS